MQTAIITKRFHGFLVTVLTIFCVGPAVSWAQDLDALLSQLDERRADFVDMTARFTFRVTETIREEEDDPFESRVHEGQVRLLREAGGGRTWIEFTRWNDGNVWYDDDRRWYVFDGTYLDEAREKEEKRQRYQVVPEGQRVDPFRLGEGPFPLPFGQSREDMLAEFDIRLGEPDEAGRAHLIGMPKQTSELAKRYERVDLFLARKGPGKGMTEKIVLHDRKDRQIKTITFFGMKVNTRLKPNQFALPEKCSKWPVFVRPLEDLE